MSPSAMYQALRAWWHGMRERKAAGKKEAPRGSAKPPVRAKAPPPPPLPVEEPPPPVARAYEPPPPTPTPALGSLKVLKSKADELAEREWNRKNRRETNARLNAALAAKNAPVHEAARKAWAKQETELKAKAERRDAEWAEVLEWVREQKKKGA